MSDSGTTTRTTGSTLILSYLPHAFSRDGVIAAELEAYGEEITEIIKITERKVRDQHWIDSATKPYIDKIGLGLANIKRFEDNDTDYRRRIKSAMAFDGGGNLNTLTGVSEMEQNSGSWFAWNVLRQACNGTIRVNRVGRVFGETGNATRIEFVTGGIHDMRYPDRFHQEVNQFRAMGTIYDGFGQCIPANQDIIGNDTGGILLRDVTGTEGGIAKPITVTTDAADKLFTGHSFNLQFDSFSYDDTGEMGIITTFGGATWNAYESGHVFINFAMKSDTTDLTLNHVKVFSSLTQGINRTETGHYIAFTGGTFREGSLNQIPEGWFEIGATCEIETGASTHNRVLELDNTVGNQAYCSGSVPNQPATGWLEFYVRNAQTNRYTYIYLFHQGGVGTAYKKRYIMWNDGTWKHYEGSWKALDTPTTYTADVWDHVKIAFDCPNDSYKIYINNVLKSTDAGDNPASPDIIDAIYFRCGDTPGGFAWIDSIDWSGTTGYYVGRNLNQDSGWDSNASFPTINSWVSYDKTDSGTSFGDIPTSDYRLYKINMYNYNNSLTGQGFDPTKITGMEMVMIGQSGSTINIHLDGIHLGKQYSQTGSYM